LFSTDKIQVK